MTPNTAHVPAAGQFRPRDTQGMPDRRTGRTCTGLCPGAPDFALAELMRVPIQWAEEQFRALGRRDAHDLAVSLIAAYEGSALLTNTFRDPDILAREARRLDRWIDTL